MKCTILKILGITIAWSHSHKIICNITIKYNSYVIKYNNIEIDEKNSEMKLKNQLIQ